MKGIRIYFIIATLLLAAYLVAELNKPTPVNWQASLYYNDKIPYGTYIFYHQLGDLFPKSVIKRTNQSGINIFQDTTLAIGNYFIIAKTLSLDKQEIKALTKFVSAGHNVFISTFSFGQPLSKELKLKTAFEFNPDKITLNFTNSNLKTTIGYTFKPAIASNYFSGFDTAHAVSLAQNQFKHTTFLKYSYGKGSLYLMANPQLLTNYNLLKPGGANYAERVISYLPAINQLYWDQYQNHDIAEDESPMRVFLDHDDLRWAYYIALASMLTFILYEMKRRQRIIPVIEPLKNSTLDFVTVVGRVYYEQRNNSNIALKKIIYFSDYLRTHYQLKAEYRDKDFVERLAQKSGMDYTFITELIDHINYMSKQPRVSDNELIILNNLIDKFYAQA